MASRPVSAQPNEGAVIWLTGLSGAGKTTIARATEKLLQSHGYATEVLDGDEIRKSVPSAGFTRPERERHIQYVGLMASRLERHGVVSIIALISPYEAARNAAREMCRRFIEVHVATPLEECERRDVKGLYARARRGEIRQFTGIDDPFEPPKDPELVVDTAGSSPETAAQQILFALRQQQERPTEATG